MRRPGSLRVTTPSDREVVLTREFDAPRRLVYKAYTTPALVKRWSAGPPGWSMTVCEIDLRVGGAWRSVLEGPGGEQMKLGGVYREIVPDTRLVSTEAFDPPWYEGDAISSVDLIEKHERTTLTMTVRYASQAVRDLVLETPMAEGVGAGLDKLEELLPMLATEGETR
jgi:uncharacterized protein YndB with AHSA1/START domain